MLWLWYVAFKTPARDLSSSLFQPQRWEQSLSDIHHPVPVDSLIPMFEGMVDRALLRTQPDSPVSALDRAIAPAAKGAAAGSGAHSIPAPPRSSKK
jgi:hypothetical protein